MKREEAELVSSSFLVVVVVQSHLQKEQVLGLAMRILTGQGQVLRLAHQRAQGQAQGLVNQMGYALDLVLVH